LTNASASFPGSGQNSNEPSSDGLGLNEASPVPGEPTSVAAESENDPGQDQPGPSEERKAALTLSATVAGVASSFTKLKPKKKKKESLPYVGQDDEELSLLAMKVRRKREDIDLRRMIAKFTMWIVVIQLTASNGFMGWYLWFNADKADKAIMLGWMSSSVIEIVGIMAIVAGSLFPNKKSKSNKEKT